jgi:hypothetical protein
MNATNTRPSILSGLGALAHRIAAVVRECHEAQLRMAAVATATDRYVANPDAAPDTYAEFLFRTSGPLLHEPSARSRARGHGALR